jgi:UDP-2,3-diacylglucosamine pyrophosphatase LpxH
MSQGDHRYRTVFISDVHLGTKGCQAELLLDFIRTAEFDTLYLVGDIIDGWKLRNGWYWPQAHNDVVQKILRLARKGVKVIYVPGNHDEAARDFIGHRFGEVLVARDAIHETADGRRFLVTHGDEFDGVLRHARWLAFVGDWSYRSLLSMNTVFNRFRRRMGFGYWSLSAYLKLRVKNAVQFIDDILYINDGDWVESCTAVAERHDGELVLLDWSREHRRLRRSPATLLPDPAPRFAA